MNDLEFARRCAKADKQAWNEFVEKYSRLVYSYIHSVLRLKGVDGLAGGAINDLSQGVFYLLLKDNFKKLKTYKGKNNCSLASWLRQVTINYAIDHVRKIKTLESIDDDTGNLSFKDILADGAASPRDMTIAKERFKRLKECIARLGLDEKAFLELHINQNIGLNDLTGIFEVSRGALDMRKARIVSKLRECFRSKGFVLDY